MSSSNRGAFQLFAEVVLPDTVIKLALIDTGDIFNDPNANSLLVKQFSTDQKLYHVATPISRRLRRLGHCARIHRRAAHHRSDANAAHCNRCWIPLVLFCTSALTSSSPTTRNSVSAPLAPSAFTSSAAQSSTKSAFLRHMRSIPSFRRFWRNQFAALHRLLCNRSTITRRAKQLLLRRKAPALYFRRTRLRSTILSKQNRRLYSSDFRCQPHKQIKHAPRRRFCCSHLLF